MSFSGERGIVGHCVLRKSTLGAIRRITWGAGHNRTMKTFLLYVVTAIAEIVGCYLPWLWLRQDRSAWLLVPGAIALALFAWLLTLHPAAAGRVYAAYGGVYISVAIVWLWLVDGMRPTPWDIAGVVVALAGMGLIAFQPR
jgi:small multidrug resistance family-3 protein